MSKFFGKKIKTHFQKTSAGSYNGQNTINGIGPGGIIGGSLSSSASSLASSLSSPSSPGGSSLHSVKETSVMVKSVDQVSGQKMINKYQVIKEIGRGVYGKVKLCIDTNTNQFYALKIIVKSKNKKFGKLARGGGGGGEDGMRIKREIAILKRLNHPNVIHLYEVIDDPNEEKIYLVLEYVDGGELVWKTASSSSEDLKGDGNGDSEKSSAGNLSAYEEEPVLPISTVKSYLLQMIVGLEYLHFQGIIHRDIKPQNILIANSVDPMASVKIADFGVSFFSERLQTCYELDDEPELSKTAGSPAFFAPELCGEDDPLIDQAAAAAQESQMSSELPSSRIVIDSSPDTSTENSLNRSGVAVGAPPALMFNMGPPAAAADLDLLTPIREEESFRFTIPGSNEDNSQRSAAVSESSKPKFSVGMESEMSALTQGSSSGSEDAAQKQRQPIGKAIDVWALGVTLFCMIYGRLPFIAQTEYELFSLIPTQPLKFPDNTCRGNLAVSDPELIELIKKFLEKDPKKRITLAEAKRHPWLRPAVPGKTEEERDLWLYQSAPEVFCKQQMDQAPAAVSGYDASGRIKVSDAEVRHAVSVGVVFKKIVEAVKRRLSKGINFMSPTSPSHLSTSSQSLHEQSSSTSHLASGSNRWGSGIFRRKSSSLLQHSSSNQSIGSASLNTVNSTATSNSDEQQQDGDQPDSGKGSQTLPRNISNLTPKPSMPIDLVPTTHRRSSSMPTGFIEAADGMTQSPPIIPEDVHGSMILRKQTASSKAKS